MDSDAQYVGYSTDNSVLVLACYLELSDTAELQCCHLQNEYKNSNHPAPSPHG